MADDSTIYNQDDDTTTTTFPRPRHDLLNLPNDASRGISPLEQEVLDEYSRLLANMNQLTHTLTALSSGPITLDIAEQLRLLERKVASVYTLMKASVYSIVLQQGQVDAEGLEGSEYGAETGMR
ncbi:hypothetical protein LTR70_008628 [Exophiala xenobiotica]|uniref:DASH complex subunit DAD3 n=1 Tax=Lithohypha guttulata TaxID=1690604 RepID=A0ABR0K357_9EURO|nr:hypothetical protein LTR24_008027 [Lithohypha guttulata]KAK5311706.1 hypothetical protein LTR70_008628 [Exophiala xenobiotica]